MILLMIAFIATLFVPYIVVWMKFLPQVQFNNLGSHWIPVSALIIPVAVLMAAGLLAINTYYYRVF